MVIPHKQPGGFAWPSYHIGNVSECPPACVVSSQGEVAPLRALTPGIDYNRSMVLRALISEHLVKKYRKARAG
jgi:hypothetical protein